VVINGYSPAIAAFESIQYNVTVGKQPITSLFYELQDNSDVLQSQLLAAFSTSLGMQINSVQLNVTDIVNPMASTDGQVPFHTSFDMTMTFGCAEYNSMLTSGQLNQNWTYFVHSILSMAEINDNFVFSRSETPTTVKTALVPSEPTLPPSGQQMPSNGGTFHRFQSVLHVILLFSCLQILSPFFLV